MPTYAAEGNIFSFGATASLAWELPHDPYALFRKPAEAIHRRKDMLKPILKPVVLSKNVTYQYRPVAFLNKNNWSNLPVKWLDKVRPFPTYQKRYDNGVHFIHRRTRRDLFLKIEKFLNA